MNSVALIVLTVCLSSLSAVAFAAAAESPPAVRGSEDIANQMLDADLVTTSWDLSFLFEDREAAPAEYRRLELASEQINQTNRPQGVRSS
jgi:hypothetical protein